MKHSFKEGDSIKCIQNQFQETYLTIGRMYNVSTILHDSITTIDDSGIRNVYDSNRFVLDLIPIRNSIIDDILK